MTWRRRACRRLPAVEGLEDRQLLATTLTEFPLSAPNVDPSGMTLGPDGNLWFGETPASKIGRITPAGTITEFTIPSGVAVGRPAVGSDGNLWALADTLRPNGDVYEVARVTPTGVVTEFPIQPLAGSFSPSSLTLGPDGNLWFPEGAAVGRVTPSGAVTQYALPAHYLPSAGPITVGPDGNLWFIERIEVQGRPTVASNIVARITPTGAITEFPLPAVESQTGRELTVGPDGNLWFIQSGSPGEVGRITTAGELTFFPTPSAFGVSGPLTVGPDGNLWFAEGPPGLIARITTAGTVTEFPLPGLPDGFQYPGGGPLTVGPDGNLWFPAPSEDHIGRITPSGAITAFTLPSTDYMPRTALANGSDGDLWFVEVPRDYSARLVEPPKIARVNLAAAPTVEAVSRNGVHRQPTQLVLTFNRPMDPAAVQNAGNFTIIRVDRHGRPLRRHERPVSITSASYDPVKGAVTLRPQHRLSLRGYYRLTVNGAAPGGVADIDGVLLSGSGGTGFQALIHRFGAVAPGSTGRAKRAR